MEFMKNMFEKKWVKLVILVVSVSLGLIVFAAKAPLTIVFCWVLAFYGIPWVYQTKSEALNFWVFIVGKNGFKASLGLLLYLLIRNYFAHLMSNSLFESWTTFTEGTGASSLFGYTPGVILFEVTFILLAGAMIIEAFFGIFEKSWTRKTACCSIAAFLLGAFAFQTFVYSTGKVATAISQPLKQDKVAADITANTEDHGALGAIWIAGRTMLFGKGVVRIKKSYEFTMKAGEVRGPFTQFDGHATDVFSTPDSDFIIVLSSGREYRKGEKFPPLNCKFHIKAFKESTIELKPVET